MYQGARRRPAPDAMRPRKRDKAPKGRPARVLCETCSRRRALAKRALPEAAPRRERGGRRRLAARASAFPRPPFKGAGDAASPLRGAPAPSKMGGAPRGRREAFRERSGHDWIGNTYLDGFDRISPALLNSTGLM